MSDWLRKLMDEDESEAAAHELLFSGGRGRVHEISLVDRAANRRQFLLLKRDAETDRQASARIIKMAIAEAEAIKEGEGTMDVRAEFEKAATSGAAASVVRKAAEAAHAMGELVPGNGVIAGLMALAIETGADGEQLRAAVGKDILDLERADVLAGRNLHIEAKMTAKQAIATEARKSATYGAEGSASAETMKRARAMVAKSVRELDLVDAILAVRREDPELRDRSDRESLGR